jgi:hypothetical protein
MSHKHIPVHTVDQGAYRLKYMGYEGEVVKTDSYSAYKWRGSVEINGKIFMTFVKTWSAACDWTKQRLVAAYEIHGYEG